MTGDDSTARPPVGLTRRGFVAAATRAAAREGGTTGGVVAGEDPPARLVGRPPEIEAELPQPDARKLGWAVAGLGHFATSYQIPALGRARRSKLAALVSGNAEKAAEIARRTGVPERSVYSYETFDSIRDDPDVDVVYVVTPNALHRDLVVRAFEAGKHVMVEKPMGASARECLDMIAARDAAGKKLMVAYRAHFEPVNLEAFRMIEAGELGEVSFAASDHQRPLDPSTPKDQWRMKRDLAGGGSFIDIGIYGLNGLIWFLGERPAALSAHAFSPPGAARFAEVEAVCAVRLLFPSGRLVNLSSSYLADTKRIDVFGDRAVASLDPATEYMGNRLMVKTAQGTQEVSSEFGSQVQFEREIDHLSQAILEGGEVLTPGEMGLRDVRLIEAVYRSAAAGGAWLSLNEDGTVAS